MIRLFNSNNPVLIPALFVITVVMNLVLFIMPGHFVIEQTNAPFSRLFFHLSEMLINNNHYVLSVLAIVLVFLQALFINKFLNDIKLFEQATYVPALVYIVIACLFEEFLYLTPLLVANTFVIFIISKAFQFSRKQDCMMDIYDMGLLIGISSLFYFPASTLLILVFVALSVFRAFAWREWVVGLLGFLTAYFLIGTYYFVIDQLPDFVNNHILKSISISTAWKLGLEVKVLGGYVLLLVVLSLFTFQANFLKSPIQIRKFLLLLVWSLVLLSLSFLLKDRLTPQHFAILSVPLSVFISYFLMNIKKKWIADVLFGILFAAAIFFQYFKL